MAPLIIYTRTNPDNPQQTLRTPQGAAGAQTRSEARLGPPLGLPSLLPRSCSGMLEGAQPRSLPSPTLRGLGALPPLAPGLTQCTELWVSWAPCSAWEADLEGFPIQWP